MSALEVKATLGPASTAARTPGSSLLLPGVRTSSVVRREHGS